MYEFGSMPMFDMDYFNSPAFQQAIAAAVEQYSPAPVEPVYYAPPPEPVYYAPEPVAGIGRGGEYDYYQPELRLPEEVYVSQGPSAEEVAAAQAEADRAVAQAEAQRIAAEEEYFARVEAERVSLARAQALEAEAERTQNEAVAARAEQARIAAEQAAAERVAAEQAAVQAQVQAQAAEQSRVQAEQVAAVAPAPEPVFTPEPEQLAGIGRSVDENYYVPEVQAPEQTYTPAPVAVPEIDITRGIGGREVFAEPDYGFAPEQIYAADPNPAPVYAPPSEPVYTPAAEPVSIEAEPVAGIGSPAVAATAEAPSVIETAVAAPAAGGPLTQEQYDAMADRRAAANALPRGTYIAAPTDNFGKPTGFETPGELPNTFQYRGGPVRVTDRKGKVLFSGEGEEGAVAAARFAQNLSDTKGKKASWDIQEGERTINPDGSVGEMRWVSGPTDAKEGMGTIGNLAAFLLPIAAAIAAGPLGLAAQIAMGAAAGGVGAVMSGNDPLKAALIAGASAGIMNVSGANEAISGTLNKISGTLASKVTEEGVKKAGEELAEQIVVTGLSKAVQAAGSAAGNTLLSEAVKSGLGDITGYQTPAERFVEQPLPEALQPPVQLPLENAIVVSGSRVAPAVADAVTGAISGIGSAAAADVINQPAAPEPTKTAEEILEEETGEIVSLGEKTPSVNVPIPGIGTPGVVDPVTGDIVVSKPKPEPEIVTKEPDLPVESVLAGLPLTGLPTPDPALTDPKSTLDKIRDAADIATAVLPIVGGVVGGGGGGGGTIAPDTSKINFTKSPLRPTLTGAGIGGVGGRYPYTPQTYGRAGGDQETEYLFFTRDPVTGQETVQAAPAVSVVNPATIPVKKEGGEIEDDMVKHLVEYHKNGGHHGPGQVKGIGSGQEDKIPAWLSDGEYVWSAQDVSDLGDGSNKEGVRRLDKMRQIVRRQAGRKDVKKIAKPQKGIDTMLKAVGGLV
jgi:hypothetical protein